MKQLVALIISVLLILSIPVYANSNNPKSPYLVLEHVGQQLFTRIANNQERVQKFPDLMRTIVEEELMPYIDYQYAAYRILGTKHLKKSTKQQRQEFVNAMRQYLVRTYANALMQYKNQKVTFEPDKPVKGKKIVTVNALISEAGRPDIKLAFKLRKHKKSKQWKAYDMSVEGISLLSSKQAEINRKIADVGLDQVTVELAYLTK